MIALFALTGAGSGTPTADSTKADASKLVHDNSHKTGTGSVQLVEFGDYQCPSCGAAHPIVQELQKEYEGKITFIFRNFPLPMHQNAIPAAEAAEAAGDQGKYWEMHKKLFESQTQWENTTNPVETFAGYAQELGLNVDQFKKDLTDHKFRDFINADKADGEALNITGTPTFYINGQKSSDFSKATLKGMIDEALK
jgi:protein-disulfide isomerase